MTFKLRPRKKMAKRLVNFEFYAPQAEKVQVAATFNDWKPERTSLRPARKGFWKATVALAPGRYEYRYFVDGTWQNAQDPVECVPNAFGTWNCVVIVI